MNCLELVQDYWVIHNYAFVWDERPRFEPVNLVQLGPELLIELGAKWFIYSD